MVGIGWALGGHWVGIGWAGRPASSCGWVLLTLLDINMPAALACCDLLIFCLIPHFLQTCSSSCACSPSCHWRRWLPWRRPCRCGWWDAAVPEACQFGAGNERLNASTVSTCLPAPHAAPLSSTLIIAPLAGHLLCCRPLAMWPTLRSGCWPRRSLALCTGRRACSRRSRPPRRWPPAQVGGRAGGPSGWKPSSFVIGDFLTCWSASCNGRAQLPHLSATLL